MSCFLVEDRTFSKILGFDNKAKNLSIEAEANDFNMCFRGQERRRELDLC